MLISRGAPNKTLSIFNYDITQYIKLRGRLKRTMWFEEIIVLMTVFIINFFMKIIPKKDITPCLKEQGKQFFAATVKERLEAASKRGMCEAAKICSEQKGLCPENANRIYPDAFKLYRASAKTCNFTDSRNTTIFTGLSCEEPTYDFSSMFFHLVVASLSVAFLATLILKMRDAAKQKENAKVMKIKVLGYENEEDQTTLELQALKAEHDQLAKEMEQREIKFVQNCPEEIICPLLFDVSVRPVKIIGVDESAYDLDEISKHLKIEMAKKRSTVEILRRSAPVILTPRQNQVPTSYPFVIYLERDEAAEATAKQYFSQQISMMKSQLGSQVQSQRRLHAN